MAALVVDIDAIRRNIARLRSLSGRHSKIMLVCKSNYYGLGFDIAARLEDEVDLYGVGDTREAQSLHERTSNRDIVILYPVFETDLAELSRTLRESERIVPTVNCDDSAVKILEGLADGLGARVRCYVLIADLGDRFWNPSCSLHVCKRIGELPFARVCGVFTHLASSRFLDRTEFTAKVKALRESVRIVLPGVAVGVADSHLAEHRRALSLDFHRVGLFPLGIIRNETAASLGVEGALRLEGNVVNSFVTPKICHIGYCSQLVPQGQRVAILDIGFASGLPLQFFEKCKATWMSGRSYAFLPRPWMEFSCLATGSDALPVGAQIELYGTHLSISRQAELAGVPAEGLFCQLSGRVQRIIHDGGSRTQTGCSDCDGHDTR